MPSLFLKLVRLNEAIVLNSSEVEILSQAYENYSFEELRFVSPIKRRTSETMLVRPNADGSYSANWTPSAAGLYSIHVTIDDYPLEDVYKVDVKEPPQGVLPPTHNITVRNNSSSSHRVRQFRTRASAGLRIRAQPSLQGEQIGIVACNGTVSFIEEVPLKKHTSNMRIDKLCFGYFILLFSYVFITIFF